MNATFALKSVLAFSLAMLAGYFVFSGPLNPSRNGKSGLVDNSTPPVDGGPGVVVKTGLPRSPQYAPFTPGQPVGELINRDFKAVAGGLKNDNVRMTTVISNVYAAGIQHSVKGPVGGAVKWVPSGQEVRMGDEVVSVSGSASLAEAHLETLGGVKHVVYPSTYAETDEHLYVRPEGGVEHDIILKKQPEMTEACGLAYTGYLDVSKELTVWDNKTQILGNYKTKKDIYFKNRVGNVVFCLRAPVAYDANVTLRGGGLDKEKQALQQNQSCAAKCEYQITMDGTRMKLAVVTSGRWLMDPARAYPVTIDPNFSPFGLADGNPPIYVGTVGSNSLIPVFAGGTKLPIEESCPQLNKGPRDNGYGHIVMPFDFSYYSNNVNIPAGTFLFVHIDGWASTDPPSFKYADEIPPDPAESPCFDAAGFNGKTGQIPGDGYPTDGAFYALWNDLRFSGDPDSGIYYYTDGVAPNRRLIIEWHKMNYVQDNTTSDFISFNLILYECQSIIEVIIGDITQGDSFYGDSTIGIESPGDALAVYYDLFAPPAPQAVATTPVDGLDVTFSRSPLSNITVVETNNTGCLPLTTCFKTTINTVVPLCVQLQGGASISPTFAFDWDFNDGSNGFTGSICHTYTTPQQFTPQLTVTDELGSSATFVAGVSNLLNIVLVCDLPPVSISATPAGGTAPLSVDIRASSTTPYVLSAAPPAPASLVPTISAYDVANTALVIDQLAPMNLPNTFTPYQTIIGSAVMTTVPTQVSALTPVDTIAATVLFDTPGTYRVTGVFPGTSFTLPTDGFGYVFINVVDPNAVTSNSMIVTNSVFHIDWLGKTPNSLGILPNPNDDTITVGGYINLSGMDLSSLAGQDITLALNGYNPIFQGTLDTNGHSKQGDFATGATGDFSISMPSGKFTCNVKGDYAVSLGVASQNLTSLLPANYSVRIGDVFSSPGTSVGYGYSSLAGKQAKASYTFGKFYNTGSFFKGPIPGAPNGIGQPGGQELLVSGGFIVVSADFKLQGDTVSATISGLLARSGGDDMRPAASSNVVVEIGNFPETLNFSTTPTFKTTGKPPTQKFTFKNKGSTHIRSLSWYNRAGSFQLSTVSMPNAQVGIDPQKARQPIQLTFTLTSENGQQFIGTTTFDIFKISDTEFKH